MYSDAYMPSDLAQGSFLLREINMENGEQGSFWMPSSQYNKGWNELYFTKQNEFIQDNKLTAKYCRTFMDFSDAKLLHRINHIPAMSYQEVVLKGAANYRYARYKSQPSGFCNVAEIEFYGPDGNKLKGANIGLPGSWDDSEMSCDKAFDNNVMTFYDAAKKDSLTAWTGLDFHENKLIGKIRYLPRTDGYGIYEGHRYKVFCWTGKGWEAFSETIANGN
jgi:hypothetical protein